MTFFLFNKWLVKIKVLLSETRLNRIHIFTQKWKEKVQVTLPNQN